LLGFPQLADVCYWVILIAAFGIAMGLAAHRLRPVLPNSNSPALLLLCTFIFGLAGAKLLYLIEYAPPPRKALGLN